MPFLNYRIKHPETDDVSHLPPESRPGAIPVSGMGSQMEDWSDDEEEQHPARPAVLSVVAEVVADTQQESARKKYGSQHVS